MSTAAQRREQRARQYTLEVDMRSIARFTWDYRGAETECMRCFIGTGATLADAVVSAMRRAAVDGWNVVGHGLGMPDLKDAMHVQIEGQQEQWLVTLFVAGDAAAVATHD